MNIISLSNFWAPKIFNTFLECRRELLLVIWDQERQTARSSRDTCPVTGSSGLLGQTMRH